jgi:hypothetical protein
MVTMSVASSPRERFWFVPPAMIALAVACVVGPIILITWAITSTTVGPVTVGNGGLVFWRDYPGHAEAEPATILDATSAETAEEELRAAIEELSATAAASGPQWSETPVETAWAGQSNGYGGPSQLVQVSASGQVDGTRPATDPERDRLLGALRSTAAEHGFESWTVDDSFGDWSPASYPDADGVLIDGESRDLSVTASDADGRQLSLTIQDWRPLPSASPTPSPSPTGVASGSGGVAEGDPSVQDMTAVWGTAPSSIFITASADHLLPAASVSSFQTALQPFAGLPRPRGNDEF